MVTKQHVGRSVYLQNREAELIYFMATREKTTELGWDYEEEIENILKKISWFKHTEILQKERKVN